MADNLSIAVVVKAILDAKGFEEAKASIGQLAGAANSSAPPIEGLGKKTADLGRTLGGTRGAVRDLTRVLLQNIGVTGPAGEVAKAAGLSFSAMAGSATLLAAGAAGAVAALALLLPQILRSVGATTGLGEKVKTVADGLLGMRDAINRYVESAPNASKETRDLAAALNTLALAQQSLDLINTRRQLEELQAATKTSVFHFVDNFRAIKALVLGGKELTEEEKRVADEIRSSDAAVTALTNKIALLEDAQKKGIIAGEDLEKQTRRLTEARKEQVEDARLSADFNAGQEADARRMMSVGINRSRQENEEFRRRQEQDAELTLARKRNAEEVAALEARQAADKRAQDAALLASGRAALTSFFGTNKAVRIAQAIADTYAAATRALAELGPIAGPIMAAIITAQGLANVANIRKTELAFDDPVNDLLAQNLGRKFAFDVLSHINAGFAAGMGGAARGNTYQTTINRGTTIQGGVHLGGFFGTNKTELLKRLDRDLKIIARLDKRSSI